MFIMRSIICVLSLCLATLNTNAQKKALPAETYEKAVSYLHSNYYNKTIFNLHTRANWFADSSGVWFIDYSKQGKKFKTVSLPEGHVLDLFNHMNVAKNLSKLLNKTYSEYKLPFSNVKKSKEGVLQFSVKKKKFALDIKTSKITELPEDDEQEKNKLESKSPDGKWIAFTKNYNLFIRSVETGEEFQLSTKGKKNYEYASHYGWFDLMKGENGERPQQFSVSWSNDSKWLSTQICDLRFANKMYLLDWSQDTLYRPNLFSYYRGSPGDTNMVYIQPVFYHVESQKEIKTNLPRNTHINTVGILWSDKPGIAYASYKERGFQEAFVKKIDLITATETTLIRETSETNIDEFEYFLLEEHNKILFLSERSGWKQLYSYDLKSEKTKPVTQGEFVVNSVEHIDKKNGVVYLMASGKNESMNPYHQQLYSTSLKGKMKLLTPENSHHAISFSKDGKYFVDNYSTVQIPTRTVLRESATGNIMAQLTEAEISYATMQGWKAPQVFELIAKDGKTPIYGALYKPTHFDSTLSYPLIEYSYTGPHTHVFPKSFDRAFRLQNMAELGFIVMVVDGLGSSDRSKEFHNHSYKNMGNNLEDHVRAIKYLGKKYSWIDTTRVGIYGHSAGGYDAGHALLAFPETYNVGVSSSADHDFRMEKAWWPEMYMGWPVDSTYHEVSNITIAENLKGKLLLVHGGLDDNVNPSATFKLAEALIKADKEFDLLILPSQRHGYSGKHRDYFTKKRWNYFIEHLLEAETLWNIDMK